MGKGIEYIRHYGKLVPIDEICPEYIDMRDKLNCQLDRRKELMEKLEETMEKLEEAEENSNIFAEKLTEIIKNPRLASDQRYLREIRQYLDC